MKRKFLIGILILLFPIIVFADTVTVDVSGWTQIQKNRAKSMAYRLVYNSGHNIVPTITKNGDGTITIDFPGISIDPNTVVDAQKILDEIGIVEAENAAAAAAAQTIYQSKKTSIINKFIALGFTIDELKALYRVIVESKE